MIGLMDCNNFFVSCERLFRPDLLQKPVAVLSSNDGCIVSRSEEVKEIGIPMGAPYFQVRDMCEKHGITLFSSNFTLYRDISRRVMSMLREHFPYSEVYSIDEAFFTVPQETTEADLLAVRADILQCTGIPVSIGVAQTKTIAKAASKEAKKGNGVIIMTPDMWRERTKTLSCGTIWGIGRQTTKKLGDMRIQTVEEFLARDPEHIRSTFGVVGERLRLELGEVSVYAVGDGAHDPRESIASTRSFARPTRDRAVLASALTYHISHVGEKLRKSGLVAGYMTIILGTNRFGDHAYSGGSVGQSLDVPTNDTAALLALGMELLDTAYNAAVPYTKAGVVLSNIMPESTAPLSLFAVGDTKKSVYHIVDELNARFGAHTVHAGLLAHTEKWRESKRRKSLEYTTKWAEIARVKAE